MSFGNRYTHDVLTVAGSQPWLLSQEYPKEAAVPGGATATP